MDIKSFKIFSSDIWKQVEKSPEIIEMKKSLHIHTYKFNDFLQCIAKHIHPWFLRNSETSVFYLVFSLQKILCCKIAFCKKVQEEENISIRCACMLDEIKNIKNIIHAFTIQKNFESKHSQWLTFLQTPVPLYNFQIEWETKIFYFHFTQYIPLYKHVPTKKYIRNVREYVTVCNDIEFRCVIFQILALLLKCQKLFPGFRHNDLKCDNVLITNPIFTESGENEETNGTRDYYFYELELKTNIIRQFKIPKYVQCVCIDFESTWWIERKEEYQEIKDLTKIKNDFGIYNFECNVFDIHLLCMDIIRTFKLEVTDCEKLETYKHFYLFLMDFFLPEHFKSDTLQQFRLLEKHQKIIKFNLEDMLLHPYFFGFRCITETTNLLYI